MKSFAYTGSEIDSAKMQKELMRLASWSKTVGMPGGADEVAFPNAATAWDMYCKGIWDGKDAVRVAVALNIVDISQASGISNERALNIIQEAAEEELEEKRAHSQTFQNEKVTPAVPTEAPKDERLAKQKEHLAKIRSVRIQEAQSTNPDVPVIVVNALTGQRLKTGIETRSPFQIAVGPEAAAMQTDYERQNPTGKGDKSEDEERVISQPREDKDRDVWLTKVKDPTTNKPVQIVQPSSTLTSPSGLGEDIPKSGLVELETLEKQLEELERRKMELQKRKAEQLKRQVDQICDFIEKITDKGELLRIQETVGRVVSALKGQEQSKGVQTQ